MTSFKELCAWRQDFFKEKNHNLQNYIKIILPDENEASFSRNLEELERISYASLRENAKEVNRRIRGERKREELIDLIQGVCVDNLGRFDSTMAHTLFYLVKYGSRQHDFFAIAESVFKVDYVPQLKNLYRDKLGDSGMFWRRAKDLLAKEDIEVTCEKSIYRALERLEKRGFTRREKEVFRRDRSKLPRKWKDTVNFHRVDYLAIYKAIAAKNPNLTLCYFLELIRPGINKFFYAKKLPLQKRMFINLTKHGLDSEGSCPMKKRRIFLDKKNNSSEALKNKKLEKVLEICEPGAKNISASMAEIFKINSEKENSRKKQATFEPQNGYGGYRPFVIENPRPNCVSARNYSWERGEEAKITEEELNNPLFARLAKLGESLKNKESDNKIDIKNES